MMGRVAMCRRAALLSWRLSQTASHCGLLLALGKRRVFSAHSHQELQQRFRCDKLLLLRTTQGVVQSCISLQLLHIASPKQSRPSILCRRTSRWRRLPVACCDTLRPQRQARRHAPRVLPDLLRSLLTVNTLRGIPHERGA